MNMRFSGTFLSVILCSVCCFHSNLLVTVLAFHHSTLKVPSQRSFLEGSRKRDASTSLQSAANQVLILDHLNINHEKGRHDLLKAFYFDFLKCASDPRKEENLKVGKKTLWANIGTFQFHLPEGNPAAQVFQGIVTLAYPSIKDILDHYERNLQLQTILGDSKFSILVTEEVLYVTDPWGTQFHLIQDSSNCYADTRGCQPGKESKGIAMTDLTIFLSDNVSNFAGIARFYERILGAPCLDLNETLCIVSVGPKQTLSFRRHAKAESSIHHEELVETEEGVISNYGAHVSMYVSNLREAYQRAQEIGVTYVNPRFKRRAYSLEDALEDCMFRILDIVDPDNVKAGPILKLEHEVRSVVKRDGSRYKSCPFYDIPVECKAVKMI